MPGYNGTGPKGNGPMTGGGRGRCSATSLGTAANQSFGLGGFGFGRGRRNGLGCRLWRGFRSGNTRFSGTISRSDELRSLESEAEILERSLKTINEKIGVLRQQDAGS